ncbi:MAG: PQQ-binding-like beta-propeller repeat protein [Fimbriimonadaceae bacterium]|nr:PQQ-binding-like beta-propeller repeat protein [Fimbriimonadaceae bacterium]
MARLRISPVAPATLTAALLLAGASQAQFDGPAPLAWRWVEATSASPSGTPAVDGDRVFVAVGGRVYALDRKTGNQLWRYPAGEPLTGSFRDGITFSGGKVYAVSEGRTLFALNADTGTLAWQHVSPAGIGGTPVVASDVVVFPLASTGLAGLKVSDGTEAWSVAPTPSRVFQNLDVSPTGVVFLTQNSIGTLDPLTGKFRWQQRLSRIRSTSSPRVFNDSIYFTSGTYVIALRSANGSLRWQRETTQQLPFGVAAGPDGVATVSENGRLFSYDLNGRPVNSRGFDLKLSAAAAPSFAGGFIAVPATSGALSLIDPKTGDIVWNYVIPGIPSSSASSTAGGLGDGGGMGPGSMGPPGFAPGGGGRGPGMGGGAQAAVTEPDDVVPAGPAIVAGNSLLILGRDGSLLCFDKEQGIDLVAPTARLLWPTPGEAVSPVPPAEYIIKLEDFASGINPESVKVTVNGTEFVHILERDGTLRLVIITGGANKAPAPGRATIVVTASDRLGNTSSTTFSLKIDPTIDRPLGSPPRAGAGGGAGGGGAFGP